MLTTRIAVDEIANAPEVLDRLMEEWLGYCESAGGIKLGETA